jgi:hypothetical protein
MFSDAGAIRLGKTDYEVFLVGYGGQCEKSGCFHPPT